MAINRVTITGADNSIEPIELVRLGRKYPFSEWGILTSERNTFAPGNKGTPRYPSPDWISELKSMSWTTQVLNLSLHVCGRWVRDLLLGEMSIPTEFLEQFKRIQLNFHAERTKCNPDEFSRLLKNLKKEFIFQIDGYVVEIGIYSLQSMKGPLVAMHYSIHLVVLAYCQRHGLIQFT
jgi:hypothetical protein